jgi:hypothetical protein
VIRRHFIGCAALLVALSTAPAAGAAPPDPQAVKEATSLFTKGSELYAKKSYAEALQALEASHKLVSSPNSALFVARCLRELGRVAEAMTEYEEVGREAAGDPKYAETAKAAASEAADLRATLGQVNVHVAGMPAGGQVLIDGTPIALNVDRAQQLHAPGDVTVVLRAPPAPDVARLVKIRAGDTVDLELDASPKPPPAPPARPAWMVPTLVAAGGVGLVGFGLAIGLGVSSRSTFDSLRSTCGSRCTSPDQQNRISSGQSAQTGANVSLAVGLAGVAGAAVVGVMIWRSSRPQATDASASVAFGPGRASIVGRF